MGLELISEFEVTFNESSGKIEHLRAANHIMNWWASLCPRLRQGDRLVVIRGDVEDVDAEEWEHDKHD